MDMKQTSKLLGWSKKYLSSFQGILNVCEMVICYASIRLLWDTCRPAYSLSVGGFVGSAQETYFYISSWTCLAISSVLLLSFTVSHVSYLLVERTIIVVMFWLTASVLSFITGLLLFVFVSAPKSVEVFGYSHKLGASILGLINSCLFAVSAAKSYRACKSSWSYQYRKTLYLSFCALSRGLSRELPLIIGGFLGWSTFFELDILHAALLLENLRLNNTKQ